MAFLHTFFFFFFFLLVEVNAYATSDVKLLLGKIKPSLQGKTESLVLSSWNSSVPICEWKGVKWAFSNGSALRCTGEFNDSYTLLHLVSLQLPCANLTGSLPREIGEFSMLSKLFLNINSLTGSIPLELGYASSLSEIDLSGNKLSGSLPTSVWNLCDNKLSTFKVHENSLFGELPEPALLDYYSTCSNLRVIDVGANNFSGGFPQFITKFKGLKELDLSSNMFEGNVPESLNLIKLEKLNLSYNNFTGVLPSFFSGSKFGVEVFEGNNPSLCGLPLKPCLGSSRLRASAIAGLVIGLMTGAVVTASLLIGYMQNKKRKNSIEREDDLEEGEEVEEEEGKLVVFQGGENLTLEEVLNATGQAMEKTSYGTVYKAKLSNGGTIALRLLREGSCKDRSSFLPLVKKLGRIRHENLVPLRAFYQGKRGEKLLIYDYLPNTSLDHLLHVSKQGKPVLNWARRHKIALGIARGLAYLHNGQEVPITHGNIRSRNVLVDEFFLARLTEFGLDKLMVQAVADEIMSQAKSDGYKATELHKMSKCNPRTDVYAFGILLLEILTGKKPGRNNDLPSLVKIAVLEETTMEVFDSEVLIGITSPMEDGLVQALKLAMGCCAPVPSVRPTMEEVVRLLEENRPRNRSALYSPAETRSEAETPF